MSVRILLCLAICGMLGCAGNSPAPIEDRGGTQQQSGYSSHTVKRGDTLYSIAFRYGMDFRKVAAANGIVPPYTIYPGQQIQLSEVPRVAVMAPATSYPLATPHAAAPRTAPAPILPPRPAPMPRAVTSPALGPPPVAPASSSIPEMRGIAIPGAEAPPAKPQSVALEPASNPPAPAVSIPPPTAPAGHAVATVPVTAQPSQAVPKPKSDAEPFAGEKVAAWRWPTSGTVMRGYSESVHKGIDIGGARGESVNAAAAGKVVYAGTGIAGFGELLIIKHNDVYLSAYGHNDELLVAEGDTVAAGQTIAQKGSSGTDAVKLHFEIRQEGKPIDPLRLLPAR